jgi:RNA polymerase sigma factor (sigma-70 family)
VGPRLNDEQRALVEKNIDLAHFLANQVWNRSKETMLLEEIVGVAYEGLIKAALKFDPTRMSAETVANGKAFSGFARQRIMGSILDWQREMDHVPRSYRQLYKKMRANGYGDENKNLEPLVSVLGESLTKLQAVAKAVENPATSLDDDLFDAVSHHDVESTAMERSIRDGIGDAVDDLEYIAQVIVSLRYFSGWELQQIAQELEMPLTTVYTIHSDAVLLIHNAMVSKAKEHSQEV